MNEADPAQLVPYVTRRRVPVPALAAAPYDQNEVTQVEKKASPALDRATHDT